MMIQLDARACRRISERSTTPCFAIFPQVLRAIVRTLAVTRTELPGLELAYPIKTMPLAYLLRLWRRLGRYVEASSECELHLALSCDFSPDRIIVSGPGKLRWCRALQQRNLMVLMDSVSEAESLGLQARRLRWRVGLRFAPRRQVDPDSPRHLDQFGIDRNDWGVAVSRLREHDSKISVLQFHLGGWGGDVDSRLETLHELAALAETEKLHPDVIDVGGGFQQAYRAEDALRSARSAADALRKLTRDIKHLFPTCSRVIAECGRVLLGPTAALILLVVDVKQKYGRTFVICDGGRVNHALPSDWEQHQLYFPCSSPSARWIEATICGPTCMAWDFISRGRVPEDIRPGSFVVYDAAGAYHWPWQSSFSQRRASAAIVTKSGVRLNARHLLDREAKRDWLGSSGA